MDFHKFFESPRVYEYTQKLNPFTVSLYAEMAANQVEVEQGNTILDIGSGLGTIRGLFPNARYTGVDINANYIARANRVYGGGFQVMDAGRLDFPDASFD